MKMNPDWQLDFEWLRIRHYVKDTMKHKELPKLDTVLLLVGIQETGIIRTDYTKEEKQDLMHVAVCELLSQDGFFEFKGRDQDGWPHYAQSKQMKVGDYKQQEKLIIKNLIDYFQLDQTHRLN